MEREEQGGSKQERMIERLYKASLSGSRSSLIELIKEDKIILDRVVITCFNETPLHIAAMLGHVEFAKEILKRKPELATELDSESSSPLHLASAKGNLEMVKELLKINPNVCSVTDQDGRTPLHLAAIKGRIDVMKELIRTRREVIHKRVDRGESILHLCVKHNRLEALKLLLEPASSVQEKQLLNSKDDNGNTALHLAIAKKQTKSIEVLLSKNGVEVNALNGSGLTALDILAQSPRDAKDLDIGESLRASGALRAKDIPILSTVPVNNNNNNNDNSTTGAGSTRSRASSHSTSQVLQSDDKYVDWLERKKNSLMVVSTVIGTMAFQAILSPPGGVWQDYGRHPNHNSPNSYLNHTAGTSVMADVKPDNYTPFLICTTLSLVGSMSITLLLISGLPLRKKLFVWIMMGSMWVIIASLLLAYFFSVSQLSPVGQFHNVINIILVSIITWFVLVGLVLFLHTARLVSRRVSKLPLGWRIFMWILIILVIIALVVLEFLCGMASFPAISIALLLLFSILFGMVGPVLLLQTARRIFRCVTKKTGCHKMMNNDQDHQNQSGV
ncbi:ankyrin repeat-containing protein ITN1-like [Macadamia integrifolia]|uniref:ankyrin repeat-containing protein ITN1-like n=1 Tax=Macadamia integrifolia TaxID=60698 RepID=UPI001C5276A1|nr:ankyrin repeat-containing protein ITN1-like [Macadamia integrifolia]